MRFRPSRRLQEVNTLRRPVSNKAQTVAIMQAMEKGRLTPFFEAMHEDVIWRWMGTDEWTKSFLGKQAIIETLFGGASNTLGPGSSVEVHHIHGDEVGETTVVEHSGHNLLPDGRRYDNNYCWILVWHHGSISHVREYMDTQLVSTTFGAAPNSE